jgi:hypothetical protein
VVVFVLEAVVVDVELVRLLLGCEAYMILWLCESCIALPAEEVVILAYKALFGFRSFILTMWLFPVGKWLFPPWLWSPVVAIFSLGGTDPVRIRWARGGGVLCGRDGGE